MELVTRGGNLCPVCESVEADARMDLAVYSLFECPSCGCWSSDARVRGASTSFEPQAYFENARSDLQKWEQLERRVAAAEKGIASVLDVGCGEGSYLEFSGRRRPATARYGIELDAQRAAAARQKNPDARIFCGDAVSSLAEIDAPVDLITLWDVFEHVEAPAQLLRELAGVLSPGGWIYIQTIHEQSAIPALGRLCYRLSGGRLKHPARRTHEAHHLVFFSLQGLRHMVEQSGLRSREIWFDRLERDRMDGNGLVTAATSLILGLENSLGRGLFVDLILEANSG